MPSWRRRAAARWGAELAGGEGFRAIGALLDSAVEYRRLDAFDLDTLGERFDVIYCFGILHRVKDPLELLRVLRGRLAQGGRVLVETYGVLSSEGGAAPSLGPARCTATDDYVYWGFTAASPDGLAAGAGFPRVDVLDAPVIDGQPRILAALDLNGDKAHPVAPRNMRGQSPRATSTGEVTCLPWCEAAAQPRRRRCHRSPSRHSSSRW